MPPTGLEGAYSADQKDPVLLSLSQLRQHDLLKNLYSLTSDVVISSISAKVGALSRTRGLGR